MQTLSVWQSMAIGLWVSAVMSRWLLGNATLTMRFSPLMTGFVVGVVMGDVTSAMKVTAAIQLIYMGAFSPGGTMPSEPAIAAAIAVPVALLGNKSPGAAIAVAVPVGLLGSYLYQFRFFLNTFVGKTTDRAIENMDDRALSRSIIWYPTIVSFLLFTPVIFIALYFGAPVIASFVKGLEGTVFIHMLNTVGGALASIGIAVTIYVIGQRKYLAFFLLAYFMSVIFTSLKITMVTYAIIGTLLAFIFVLSQGAFSDDKKTVQTDTGDSGNTSAGDSDSAEDDDDDF